MTAAWMWARAELRARWRAWLLLGVLAGVTVGVAAAGWAGARRTERAVPDAVAASRIPTAALLANDPSSGPAQRAEVAKLPGVTATYPFLVGFSAQVFSPPRLGADSPSLFPVTPESIPILTGALATRVTTARCASATCPTAAWSPCAWPTTADSASRRRAT